MGRCPGGDLDYFTEGRVKSGQIIVHNPGSSFGPFAFFRREGVFRSNVYMNVLCHLIAPD